MVAPSGRSSARAAESVATPTAAGCAPVAVPASRPLEVAREVAEVVEDDAAPPAVLARASEIARSAPATEKSAGTKSIRGRIVDVEGQPLAGAVVRASWEKRNPQLERSHLGESAPPPDSLERAMKSTLNGFYATQTEVRETTSGGDGRFEFTGLRDGAWSVAAWHAGFDLYPSFAAQVHGATQTVWPDATVDFVAMRVVAVAIAVTLPDGSPAPRAAIHLRPLGEFDAERDEPWDSRRSSLGLRPGAWQVQGSLGNPNTGMSWPAYLVSAAETIEVGAGSATTPVTLRLKGAPAIRGTLRFAAGAYAGAEVKLLKLAPGVAADRMQFARLQESGRGTPCDAEFFFADLDPGRYLLGVRRCWSGAIVNHAIVEVSDAVVEQDFDVPALDPARSLRVTVRDANGRGVEDVTFGRELSSATSSSTSYVEGIGRADGAFLLPLDELAIDPNGHEDVASVSAEDGSWPDGLKVTLTVSSGRFGMKRFDLAPSMRSLDVVFAPAARLAVDVPGSIGGDCSGRVVVFLEPVKDKSDPSFRDGSRNGFVATVADGTQRFGPVEPGDYVLRVWIRPREPGQWEQTLAAVQPITLVAGENRAIVPMPLLYSLTIEADGSSNVPVSLTHDGGSGSEDWSVERETDSNGRVLFEDLVAGDYQVKPFGGGNAPMRVSVPCAGVVRYSPGAMDALRIWIEDREGALAKAGFESGDVIVAVAGREYATAEEMQKAIAALLPQKRVLLTVRRREKKIDLSIDGGALANPFELGGSITPSSR